MFNLHRTAQFNSYNSAREKLVSSPNILIDLENYLMTKTVNIVNEHITQYLSDYNEASYLFPFWQNYPPDNRGRKPRGDQYPWIEVGEHAIGNKFCRLIAHYFDSISDTALPTGSDQRFIVKCDEILQITQGFTDSAWLFIDIKSAGPRDDADHAVMSHNQISGDGCWDSIETGIKNNTFKAIGPKASHDFYPSISPIYILSDGTIAPLISIAIKPVYSMIFDPDSNEPCGQPLERLSFACIPNGLLLSINPDFLSSFPGLLFPGKDDKKTNPLKVRCRVDFKILRKIADWRYFDISV